MSERRIELEDGRYSGLSAFGDPTATRWVLFCHPAPGAGGFDPDPLITQQHGLHFVSLDRPGYAASDPVLVPPQPSPERWADDVHEYLEQSRVEAQSIGHQPYSDLAVVGWREGCIWAAALAARFSSEVAAVAFVEPMGLGEASRSMQREDAWQPTHLIPGIERSRIAGLSSRVEHMLEAAAEQGNAGLDADLAAVKQRVLDESLAQVVAPTLIVCRPDSAAKRSAHRYARLVAGARVAVSTGIAPLSSHWDRIVAHLEQA